ncbi:MAG: EamA family transporter RarD, partial [Planctomycetota bacterium]|nr:EamA family transporter RarD [Planctomycetota bacterium]
MSGVACPPKPDPAPAAPAPQPAPTAQDADAARREAGVGLAFALAAYAAWGLSPIYFKAVAQAGAFEILAHRMIWAVPLLALLLKRKRGFGGVSAAVRSRVVMRTLALTTCLIAVN